MIAPTCRPTVMTRLDRWFAPAAATKGITTMLVIAYAVLDVDAPGFSPPTGRAGRGRERRSCGRRWKFSTPWFPKLTPFIRLRWGLWEKPSSCSPARVGRGDDARGPLPYLPAEVDSNKRRSTPGLNRRLLPELRVLVDREYELFNGRSRRGMESR
jgi:hypothetical protein